LWTSPGRVDLRVNEPGCEDLRVKAPGRADVRVKTSGRADGRVKAPGRVDGRVNASDLNVMFSIHSSGIKYPAPLSPGFSSPS
jgi:hypothetical protein